MRLVRIVAAFLVVAFLLSLLLLSVRARHQAQAVQSPDHLAGAVASQTSPVPPPDLGTLRLPGKGHPKLESSLDQLAQAFGSEGALKAASVAQSRGIDLRADTVRVIIEVEPGRIADAAKAAEQLGGVSESSTDGLIQALMPLSSLAELASQEAVRYVREPIRFLPAAITEGANVSGVPAWRTAGLTGAGVKVAVVDFGFTGYGSLLGSDLPPQVIAKSFRSDGRLELPESADRGRHGTAAAEIVYDMAPSAQVYLVAFETDVELEEAVDWLIAEGVDIVSFSIGSEWGAGDGTGPVDDIVAKAADAGILWVNAAGNSAQEHWSGQWSDATVDGWLDFEPGHPVNTLLAAAGDAMIAYLRWDDPFDGSCNDYDLYVLDPALLQVGLPLYSSENVQNCSSHPTEEILFVAPYTGIYYVAVHENTSTRSPRFDLFFQPLWCLVGCPMLDYKNTSGSLIIPADSPKAFAVGAVPWDFPSTIEDFSSQGPTTDGRIKPDLVAPDRVSTSSYGANGFPGTSAAAPHVAGAAALVKQANPSFSWQDITTFLEGQAVDLGTGGKDNVYGSGRLALGAPPSPTPTPTATAGATRTVDLDPEGWHELTWSGPSGTEPGTALSCISGKYNIAYAWEGPAAGFKRYVEGCPVPGICNMSPLDKYDSMLVLTSAADATCQMPVAALTPTEGATRTVDLSPQGWQELTWSGPSGTEPGAALACISGKYSIAYAWEGPTAGFKRYVEGCSVPGICNMSPLDKYDSMLVLTSAADATCQMPVWAAPTATPTETATPTITASPTPTRTPTPTPASGTVTTRRSSWHVDVLDAIWVVGEVYNGLNRPVGLVEVTANFYSASGGLLATESGFACLTTVAGQADSPFDVLLISPPPGVDHVQVGVTDYVDPPFEPPVVGLDPTVTNVYTDVIGYRHAVGTVKNNSLNTYEFVQPCAAFYNAADLVVQTDWTFAEPSTLKPGASGTFDASVPAEGAGIVAQRVWVEASYGN